MEAQNNNERDRDVEMHEEQRPADNINKNQFMGYLNKEELMKAHSVKIPLPQALEKADNKKIGIFKSLPVKGPDHRPNENYSLSGSSVSGQKSGSSGDEKQKNDRTTRHDLDQKLLDFIAQQIYNESEEQTSPRGA